MISEIRAAVEEGEIGVESAIALLAALDAERDRAEGVERIMRAGFAQRDDLLLDVQRDCCRERMGRLGAEADNAALAARELELRGALENRVVVEREGVPSCICRICGATGDNPFEVEHKPSCPLNQPLSAAAGRVGAMAEVVDAAEHFEAVLALPEDVVSGEMLTGRLSDLGVRTALFGVLDALAALKEWKERPPLRKVREEKRNAR
jgi:hypothetical protein